MLKPQEALLETTAQKIARILIRQYGIHVRVEGSRACIDMETMTVLSGKEGEGGQGQAGGDDQDQDGDQEGEESIINRKGTEHGHLSAVHKESRSGS